MKYIQMLRPQTEMWSGRGMTSNYQFSTPTHTRYLRPGTGTEWRKRVREVQVPRLRYVAHQVGIVPG